MENYQLLNCSHYFIKKNFYMGTVIKMKKIKVLTILGIFMVSAMIFSVPPAAAVAPEAAFNEDAFISATTSLLVDLDPQYSWDSASSDVNGQVWEGLFAYQLGDPSLRIIPRLAADCGAWRDDGMMFDVMLREGVTYHNGDAFNASCVVESFQRLYELCLYEDDQIGELYFPYGINGTVEGVNDEATNYGYVIKEVTALETYKVRFELNFPFMPFQGLLCFGASSIMHPDEPKRIYLESGNINNGTAIGTGPYKLMEQTSEYIDLEYYEDYYRGVPAIRKIRFKKYADSGVIGMAFLNEEVDIGTWNPDMLQDFIDSPAHTVEAKRTDTIIRYMGYNNKLISRDWRKAMNLAVNYDYINEEICAGTRARMTSVVPVGINYHIDCGVANFSIEDSRQYIVDNMDIFDDYALDMDSPDQDWIDVAEADPLQSYVYTFNLGNEVRANIGIELKTSFKLIGVNLIISGITWAQFVGKMHTNPDSLDLYMVGWMPDYNDPSNYINPLMSNTSGGNAAQVNDHKLQLLIDAGITETDLVKREQIYHDIQRYVAEDLEPWSFMGTGFGYSNGGVHLNEVRRQRNAMGVIQFFPWGWNEFNTTYTDAETVFQSMWCSETTTEVGEDYWPEPGAGTGIPGYSMFVLLGVVAATIVAIIKKRK